MRDKSVLTGAVATVIAAMMLAGCSSVSEIPYPNLAEITRAEDPSLSPEERAAMIEDLKQDQQTHEAAATEAIEKR
jgi:outer membrane murein-binding lipoprotein Lpp